MRPFRRFLALRARQRLFLIHCLIAVTAIRLGLKLMPYKRLRRLVEPPSSARHSSVGDLRQVSWGVTAAARLIPGPTWLTPAGAGQFLLPRGGKRSQIHIGIERGSAATLKAHAWLVSGKRVVLGGPAGLFTKYNLLDLR
jgi:hypothetical protein